MIGIVIDTIPNPTISDNLNIISRPLNENDDFEFNFIGFLSNQKYYYRAFATNDEGTGYGNEITFTSPYNKFKNETILLNGQEQVNEFGAQQFTGVERISIIGAVNDLTPLSSLVYSYTGFVISNTTGLTNLNGLSNLEYIGLTFIEGLSIDNNEDLVNLEGINNLKCEIGKLEIKDNPKLESLNGLENLEQFNDGGISSIEIINNSTLTNFCALKPLLNAGFSGDYNVMTNQSNPTIEEIINDCL